MKLYLLRAVQNYLTKVADFKSDKCFLQNVSQPEYMLNPHDFVKTSESNV